MEYEKKKPKMVQVGRFSMTQAAFITFLTGIILSVCVVIIAPNKLGIISAIYALIVFSLISFNVNCVQLGHCLIWGWILTVIYVVGAVVGLYHLYTKQNNVEEVVESAVNVASSIGKSVSKSVKKSAR